MDMQLQALTAETIPFVQHECAGSVFWELSVQNQHTKNLDSLFEKEAWLATGMLDGIWLKNGLWRAAVLCSMQD